MFNLSREAYLFAQALDNSGEAEYWRVRERGIYDKLNLADTSLHLVRAAIDDTLAHGWRLPVQTRELECRATLSGVGVITLRPTTLDVDGRVSPVLLLFYLYGGIRGEIAATLSDIPHVTHRVLSHRATAEIEKLQRTLKLPRPLLFLSLILEKIRSRI